MNFELLTDTELELVLSLLPRPVLRQLQTERGAGWRGGLDVVAGIPVKDLDVFCHSETQTERLAIEVSPFVRRTLFACSVDLGIPVHMSSTRISRTLATSLASLISGLAARGLGGIS